MEWDDFRSLTDGEPVTRRLHVAFYAPTHALVDAFHRAGVEAGYTNDGEPGPRPQYSPEYYGAFLLDPDGNSIEAVYTDNASASSARSTICGCASRTSRPPRASTHDRAVRRLRRRASTAADHTQLVGETAVVLADRGRADAQRPHRLPRRRRPPSTPSTTRPPQPAMRATGRPASAPVYHPGYYAAFVLDPDGNNVEVVAHHR